MKNFQNIFYILLAVMVVDGITAFFLVSNNTTPLIFEKFEVQLFLMISNSAAFIFVRYFSKKIFKNNGDISGISDGKNRRVIINSGVLFFQNTLNLLAFLLSHQLIVLLIYGLVCIFYFTQKVDIAEESNI